jgi:hypothetical protein
VVSADFWHGVRQETREKEKGREKLVFVISKQPQFRGLIIFVIGDA